MKVRFYVLGIHKPLRKRIALMNDGDMIESWEKREEYMLNSDNLRFTNDTGPY
ncbi:MAG TPA: hypothetical protein VMX17_13775 [Candidatus Glassbacteria bacterium]|nr:hypothetical protein [Candidatus Glassbacteria bacterium]